MSAPPAQNPYVGPRAFEEGEGARFFGRDRELDELFHLLLARRLVLLYAPSGAGKSSLVRAALIPRLRDEGFLVRPVIRVGVEAAAGLGLNRFRAATLLGLDEGRPPAERLSVEELTSLSLRGYLARLPPSDAEEVLIFDQFEEIISADPADRAAKDSFFAELGALLEDPRRWALFVLREDFLGALKPLLLPIPTRLAATYRLSLLSPAQARRAMQGPARAAGVSFSDEAADRLADDLRRSTVQRPDGASEAVLGESIEPVQLQVACYQLWERLFAGHPGAARAITPADVAAAGDVDSALRAYYAGRVAAIAATGAAPERRIREWVEGALITEAGMRGQVLREPEATGGLRNAAVGQLVDAHLVRGEERRGATWYELAHDRLIAPIRQDNAAWFEANLSALQRQALLWDRAERPDGLLPRGAELRRLMGEAAGDLSPVEQLFLREAQAIDRQRRGAVARNLLVFALAGCAIGLLYGVTQFYLRAQSLAIRGSMQVIQLNTAEADARAQASLAQTSQAVLASQLRLAQAQRLAAQSQTFSGRYPDRARLLAVEALRASDPPVAAAVQALHDSLAAPLGVLLPATAGISGALWLSPSGQILAAAGGDGALRAWDVASPEEPPTQPGGPPIRAALVAFSPDSSLLVAADAAGAWAWPVARLSDPPIALDTGGAAVGALAFDRDGALVAGCADGLLRRWPPGGVGGPPQVLRGPGAAITAISFSARFGWVVAGDASGGLFYWADPEGEPDGVALPRRDAAVDAVILDVDGQQVASLAGGRVVVSGLDAGAAPPAEIRSDEVLEMRPTGSTELLLSTRRRPGVGLDISLGSPDSTQVISRGAFEEILAQAISPTGGYIASGGRDGVIRLRRFSVSSLDREVLLAGHSGEIRQLAFNQGGDWLASQGADGDVRVWRIAEVVAGREPVTLSGFVDYVRALRFTPDGASLAIGAGEAARWPIGGPGGIVERPLSQPASLGFLTATAISADGRFVAFSSTVRDTLDVYDLGRSRPDPSAPLVAEHRAGGGGALALAFSPDGARLAALTAGAVALWRSDDLTADPLVYDAQQAVRAIAFSPDGRTLALGVADGSIALWSPEGGAATKLPADSPASLLAFSPDGRGLAAAGASGVQLFDLGAGGPPRPLAGIDAAPTALRFSPDGRLLAAGGPGALLVWKLTTPEVEPTRLTGFEGGPEAIAFSPDGARLAIGGLDGNVYLHATANLGDEPLVLRGHRLRVYALAFSPDGRRLASGGRDLTVRVWRLDTDDLVALACQSAGRDLSLDEWGLYMGRGIPYRPTCP